MTTQRPHSHAGHRGAIIASPGDGERFVRENRVVTIRVELPQVSIHEIEFDSTFEVPPHSHDHADVMLVLDGEVELLGDARAQRVRPGAIVAVPPGVRHGFRNPGPTRARILALHAPDGGFADLVRGTRA
jgi:quercetin dioxygenase-like cupin family protein